MKARMEPTPVPPVTERDATRPQPPPVQVPLHRGLPVATATGGWRSAAAALDRAGRALHLQRNLIAATIALMLVVFFSGDASLDELTELWIFGVPLATAITQILLVIALISAAGQALQRTPRLRLHVSAVMTTAATAISMLRLAIQLHGWLHDRKDLLPLPAWLPALSLLAAICLISALWGYGAMLAPPRARARLGTWTLVAIFLLLLQAGLQELVLLTGSTSHALSALIASSGASIFAMHVLGQMCRWTAEELRDHEQLPAATVLKR